MKTTEEDYLYFKIPNVALDKVIVRSADKKYIVEAEHINIEEIIQAAKAERDEYWKEKVKEATRLRLACACLKPNCEKDGWNSAMESVERKLLSKKAENE